MAYAVEMQTRLFLADYIENHELCPGANTLDEWIDKDSLEFRITDGRTLKVPLWGLKQSLATHDIHHALTEYPTTLRGEVEIAAWELASGGCHRHLVFWFDRLGAFALGLLVYPKVTLRALRRGWGSRNLYRMNLQEILSTDVDQLRTRMRL